MTMDNVGPQTMAHEREIDGIVRPTRDAPALALDPNVEIVQA